MPIKDITSQTFTDLTVVERGADDKSGNVRWICVCICGNETLTRGPELRQGSQTSCGCKTIRPDQSGKNSGTYVHGGEAKHPAEYAIWASMRERCYGVNTKAYPDYGGRGIYICERWQYFPNFYADMGDKPNGLSIDRIDNDGPYSPENCRWATRKEQARNKRSNRLITFNGETHCCVEWAEITGINRNVIDARLDKLGWTVEHALTKPVRLLTRRDG